VRLRKKDEKRNIKCIREIVLPECTKGNRQYLGILQSVFACADEKELQRQVASLDEEILSSMSIRELIWLSENFRNMQWNFLYEYGYEYAYHTAFWNTDFRRERFMHLSDGQYDAVIKLGTFMADGYGRQECMERLGSTQGALPFLILRMNDWVEPIQESAFILAKERLNACSLHELLCALPILEKIESARRRDADRLHLLKDQMGGVLGQRFGEVKQEELCAVFGAGSDSFVRNASCRFVNQNPVLEQEQMEHLLSLEKAAYGKRLLIQGIFRYYGCDSKKLDSYLASKSAVVRYQALCYCFETLQDAWEGLEKMLMDPSKRIREYAAYILVKHRKMDITAFYLHALQRQVSGTALLGIGENGTKQELAVVIPFLENADERIRKAAFIAYGRLAMESGDEMYWHYLSQRGQQNMVMARQAYRFICKYRISYHVPDLYRGFLQNRGSAQGECFLKLLLRAPSWQRLVYLLQLYCDTGLSDAWRCIILEKMGHRNPYAVISRQQAQEICSILEQYGQQIPQSVIDAIRFDLRYVTREKNIL